MPRKPAAEKPLYRRPSKKTAVVADTDALPGQESLGFGFAPARGHHHFLVTHTGDQVFISEHFSWDDAAARRELSFALGREDEKIRVILPLRKWESIAAEAQVVFNERLRQARLPAGRWSAKGRTPLSRLLGKELVLLAWAIEDADPGLIPRAIQNWKGLAPEERWWLFTMTNAATGHALTGRDRGWRKAVRFALTENPVGEQRQSNNGTESFFSLIQDADQL